MTKDQKVTVVHALSERLRKAKGVILAEYRGLKVSEITEIRKAVKKNAGEFKVVKNRLAKRAFADSGMASLAGPMKGPLAIAISEQDPVILSKVLSKHAETYAALKLKFAFMDGRVIDAKGIDTLAKLPSKEELYAKMLGTLMAPAQGLVRVLNGVPQKLAIVLKAIIDKDKKQ
ncbi:MAG: 50S ribosomal protein L10 [Terriglobia bacterium]